jgi:hypothetical protein
VGVRGSQWVQVVTDTYTEITALINTKLGVISTAYPEVEPVILNDFDQTTVYEGQLPSKIVNVSNKQLKQFEEDFTITPDENAAEYKKRDTEAEGYEEVDLDIILPKNVLIPLNEIPIVPVDPGQPENPIPQPLPEPRRALADLPPPPRR